MDYYTKVLKEYAVFSGRARRKEYWMFTLINLIVYIAIFLVIGMINDSLSEIILGLYALAIIIPALAVTFRRLHDTGRSGWWLLIGLIPFIGSLILLYFMIQDSTPGANIYGPNPKEGGVTFAPAAVTPVAPAPTPTTTPTDTPADTI